MKHSKYHIKLHYSVKQNDVRIFRTDAFFSTPTYELESDWEKDEQKLMMKYLSRFMRRPSSDGDIYVEEIIPNGINRDGFESFKYEKKKVFSIKNGAIIIRSWYDKDVKYFPIGIGDAYSPEKAIEELMHVLEVY